MRGKLFIIFSVLSVLALFYTGAEANQEYLWGGVNNGDIWDEPDNIQDEMLSELAKADLRVVRIWVDVRFEMDDIGYPLPPRTYNDCMLNAIDSFMVKAKKKGILLLITLHQSDWLGDNSLPVWKEFYEWRKCKTPYWIYVTSLITEDKQDVTGPYVKRWKTNKPEPEGQSYITSRTIMNAYKDRVEYILNHVNRTFGKKWKDINDVIWAWELINEPEHITGYLHNSDKQKQDWFNEMASHIKSIDPNTYVALGAKHFDYPELANIEAADIYTIHGRVYADEVQEFQETIGRPHGKLLLLEEFELGRADQDSIIHDERIDLRTEESRENSVPWMFWEYGYNFSDEYLYHGDLNIGGTIYADGIVWDSKVVPAAKRIWTTPWDWTDVGKKWKVHEMVDHLCSYRTSDCEREYVGFVDFVSFVDFVDTFSDATLESGYRWFDEGETDTYSLTRTDGKPSGYLRIEARLWQDLWSGPSGKRGAPLMLRNAPKGDYWIETFVTADPPGKLYSENPIQGINTQAGLFVFQDVDNWIFFGITNHDFPGAQGDGLILTVTEGGESRIVAESGPLWEFYSLDYAFLKIEKVGDTWCSSYHGYSAQSISPWRAFSCVDLTLATGHEVGIGVKTLEVEPPLSPGRANFDYFSLRSFPANLELNHPLADAGGLYTGNEGGFVTFDASSSSDEDEGDILQFRWDFDFDGVWDTSWSNVPTANYKWNDDYSGSVTVDVSDGKLLDTAIVSVTIQNVAPTIEGFVVKDTVGNVIGVDVPFTLAHLEIYAEGSFTDPGKPDTQTALIDWDDGTIDPNENFDIFTDAFGGVTGQLKQSHIYEGAKTYNVECEVMDDDMGFSSSVVAVKVATPEEATESLIEEIEDMITSETNPVCIEALLQAQANLEGNNYRIGLNGALEKLGSNDLMAFLVKIEAAIEALKDVQIAGCSDTNKTMYLLTIISESVTRDVYWDVVEAVGNPSKGEAKQLARIEKAIAGGHQALVDSNYIASIEYFMAAMGRSLPLL